ncbi:FAD-dependent oxidoreductase [Actinomadura sp. DSM 109109]|nr:FAD-dependent oxidoreductase [Actinomadura lepetitiana]
MSDARYDAAVVGAGSAGLNAALVLARARRRVVVDAGEPRNARAARMRGFLSRDGMSPAALLKGGRTEDVLHCPYCHGYEVRDQPLGVLGTSSEAVHQALLLRQWSEDVVLFVHTLERGQEERERLAARGVGRVEGEIKRVVADGGRVRGVELAGGRTVPRHAVFLFRRMVPNDALLTALGRVMEDGMVVTDRTGRTAVPGVWAAGNVADPRAQVVAAAGMGSAATMAVNADLVDEDVCRAVARYRAAAPGRAGGEAR